MGLLAGLRRGSFGLGLALVPLTVACNLIVGVHDVKLRKEGGATGSDDGGFPPPPPPSDDSGPEPSRYTELALGLRHSCAKRRTGLVKCWGDDSDKQTGTGGAATSDGGTSVVPTPQVVNGIDAFSIGSGAKHGCAALQGGTVSCWGANASGQLGNGLKGTAVPSPNPVRSIADAFRVAGGSTHTCALRIGGNVACWGNNLSGQLGNNTRNEALEPRDVVDFNNAIQVTAGVSHTCALRRTGEVACWGENFNGQLGVPIVNPKQELTPKIVDGIEGAVAIAAMADSTCAVLRTGTVYCWGKDTLSQLGRGASGGASNPSPQPVRGVSNATRIAAGAEHACALTDAGTVLCWGASGSGQIGNGISPDGGAAASVPLPVLVTSLSGAVAIGAGGDHSCAVSADDKISCWGSNGAGELGNESRAPSSVPVTVKGFP